jgi:transcriptional regulator GlxA family with amidase domain
MAVQTSPAKVIALIIYEELTPFDLVGPLQVFMALQEIAPEYRVVVVGERKEIITSEVGLKFIPHHTFAEVPHPFVILMPGGSIRSIRVMSNLAIRKYIRTSTRTAEFITSVCTGALVLAAVGLLNGHPATTHWAFDGILENLGSKYQRKRWIENGNIINSAGVSAGIDMALYLVSRLTDEATARLIQQRIDYDPQPPFGHIDWNKTGLYTAVPRVVLRLAAPFLTFRPKRLLQQQR